jgi:hypothetical protein
MGVTNSLVECSSASMTDDPGGDGQFFAAH